MGKNKIRQIVRLKQVMQRWRRNSTTTTTTTCHVSTGKLPVEVGPDRTRFSIPARFVNLPVFVSLLNDAQEEFGYRPQGVLSLPSCDPALFRVILDFLELDEDRYARVSVHDFSKFVDDDNNDNHSSFKDSDAPSNQPLLQKA